MLRDAAEIVRTQVYPQWLEAIRFLQTLLPKSSDDAGLWRYERGAEAYAYQLHRFTTTKLTAEEIHQIGLSQVERIEKQMDLILRQLGRTDGSVKDRIEQLRKTMSYPLTDEGRKQIMADIDGIIADAQRRSSLQFDRRPKAPVIAHFLNGSFITPSLPRAQSRSSSWKGLLPHTSNAHDRLSGALRSCWSHTSTESL